MVAVTPFVRLFVCFWVFVLAEGTEELKVKRGEDATLQCRSHRGAAITLIAWHKYDIKGHVNVYFYRNKPQYNAFGGRVELSDPQLKDGNASLFVKNVNINDTGTYKCWIGQKNNSRRRKRDAEPKLMNTIILTVTVTGLIAGHKEGGGTDGGDEEGGGTDGGDKEGGGQDRNVGLMVGLPVFAVLLVAVVGTMIFKKRRRKTSQPGGETDSLNPPTSV